MACGDNHNDGLFEMFDPEDLDLLTRFHPLNNSALLQPSIPPQIPSPSCVIDNSDSDKCSSGSTITNALENNNHKPDIYNNVTRTSFGRGRRKDDSSEGPDDDFIARQIREHVGSDHRESNSGSGSNSQGSKTKTLKDELKSIKMMGVATHGDTAFDRPKPRARGRGTRVKQ